MNRLNELFDAKNVAWKQYRDILDSVPEGTPLSAEQQGQLDALEQTIQKCDAEIEQIQSVENRRQFAAATLEGMRAAPPVRLQARGNDGATSQRDTRPFDVKLRAYSEEGMTRQQALERIASERDPAASAAFNAYLRGGMVDRAALQLNSDPAGGYLIAPEQFVARLIQDLDKMVFVRQLGTVIPLTGAETLGVPTLSADIADTNWTTELAVGTEDSTMTFGKRRLTPHPLAKWIKVSKDLLSSAAISAEAIVRERMAYKFGTVQETGFLTGSGAGQPLGVFTASNFGISTGQDVSTGNATTSMTADGLINAKYGLESQWFGRPNLRWVFHRDGMKQIRSLKDGEGQYILSPGLREDTTDRLLGVPVIVSEFAPNTFTTGLYVGIIGDFSYYWIADSMSMQIQRLVELYAGTNQDAFVGRMKLDGMPVLEKAFIRVKLG